VNLIVSSAGVSLFEGCVLAFAEVGMELGVSPSEAFVAPMADVPVPSGLKKRKLKNAASLSSMLDVTVDAVMEGGASPVPADDSKHDSSQNQPGNGVCTPAAVVQEFPQHEPAGPGTMFNPPTRTVSRKSARPTRMGDLAVVTIAPALTPPLVAAHTPSRALRSGNVKAESVPAQAPAVVEVQTVCEPERSTSHEVGAVRSSGRHKPKPLAADTMTPDDALLSEMVRPPVC
jgi:hypothetical protein